VGARRPRSRSGDLRPSGRHLLRSRQLARELVTQTGIAAEDLVVELGAGTGRITEALARESSRVVAVELDVDFVEALRRRFRSDTRVTVVHGDVLRVPLPVDRFRAFGNIPFASTTAILRRLLGDPRSPLVRADLLVEYDVARKRTSVWPSNVVSLGWLPWWEPHLSRRVPALAFEPSPSVDAALLSIVRRDPALVRPDRRNEFLNLVHAGFRHADLPVHRSLRGRIPERAWKRTARERGLEGRAKPSDLDVFDWVAMFSLTSQSTSSRERSGSSGRTDIGRLGPR
jgi:23S rRNA (adenine-N6)-dimethyltransferase